MTSYDLLVFRFLLASCCCVAAGAGVWTVMACLRQWLPEVAAQRSVWLLAQVTVAAAFLVVLLPHSERLRLVPPIDLDSVAGAVTPAAPPASAAAAARAGGAATAPQAERAGRSWLLHGAQAWLLVYLLGLAYAVARLLQARRALRGLAAAGNPVQAPAADAAHLASAAQPPAPALEVIEVDAPISPMLFGPLRPRLLLPLHLRSFEPTQRALIVEHELTHLRRHDLQWMSAGLVLQTLFWFNPCMRLLREKLSWAQELGCDRDVLRGRPAPQRKAYAAALVAQLKLQHTPATPALAFGGVSPSTLAGRISLIRTPGAAARAPWARAAAAGGLLAILGCSIAFQPALAWRVDPTGTSRAALDRTLAAFSCTAMADAATGRMLVSEGACDERVTPASTFNIAVSLMGYDSGILQDEHAPLLPFKQGYADWNPDWHAATDPAKFMKDSVVWFAQQVTARLGAARFERYIAGFGYGNRNLAGDAGRDNGLTMAWIGSSLKISGAEQVAFLRQLVNRQLALKPHAYDMTARILPAQTLGNGWLVRGKTGTAAPDLADGSDDDSRRYGWYVGWATKGERTIVFARMVLEPKQEAAAGWRTREAMLKDLEARLPVL